MRRDHCPRADPLENMRHGGRIRAEATPGSGATFFSLWTQSSFSMSQGDESRMFMCDRKNRINTVLDNHIHVWSNIPSFAPLAQVLKEDRSILEEQLLSLTEQGIPKGQDGRDAVRLFLLRYALERSASEIQSEHFTIFREDETVQVILEDSYGVRPGAELDNIPIPHQSEALKVLVLSRSILPSSGRTKPFR